MSAATVVTSSLGTSLARYSRSWGLWVVLLIAPIGARFWIPGENDTSSVITVNGHAPVLTSAMLGVSLGIVTSTLLLPAAFIYLRANVTRRQPWQIEEVTATSRIAIALGRFFADAAVLAAVLAAMTVAGWFIAWLLTPLESIGLGEIMLGLWLIAAPALMGVAAIRILFDALPPTRGALGEVLFFFIWIASLAIPAIGAERNVSYAGNMQDFAGFIRPLTHDLPPGRENDFTIGASPMQEGRIALDVMGGLTSDGYIASRFSWGAIAVLLAGFAGLVYRPHRPRRARRRLAWLGRLLEPSAPPPAQPDAPPSPPTAVPALGLVAAEFRLIADGRMWLALAAMVATLGPWVDFRTVASPAALLLLIFGLTAMPAAASSPACLRSPGRHRWRQFCAASPSSLPASPGRCC